MEQMSTSAAATLLLCTWPRGEEEEERAGNAARASISCTLALRLGCSRRRRTLATMPAHHITIARLVQSVIWRS